MEEAIAQFCGVTGASIKDARSYMTKHKRLDAAVDAWYSSSHPSTPAPVASRTTSSAPSTSKLNALYEQYKDPDDDSQIAIDGTIKMCADLGVDPEDPVLLALAFDLKSKQMGLWTKKEWVDGWKALGADNVAAMKALLPRLRTKLSSDPVYFRKVYGHTFEFARSEGQRSLAIDTAKAFWQLLLPLGMEGGALAHTAPTESDDEDEDVEMVDENEEGWKEEYNDWWFDFLDKKGGKGVSKDTWSMFLDFIRTIDAKFEKYDAESSWPSTIDDFVDWVKTEKFGQ